MKILLLSKHFWPENFRINMVADKISKDHQVDVLSEMPSYHKKLLKDKKIIHRVNINRFWTYPRSNSLFSIILNYLSFLIIGTFKIFFLKKKFDLIFIYATSPIFQALPAIIYGKIFKVPTVLWVQDLWPDVLDDLKIINNNIILNLIKIFTNFIYKNSDFVFAQSKSFQRSIRKYSNRNVSILYNPEKKSNTKFLAKKQKVPTLIFAGNLGKAQNLKFLIKSIKLVKNNLFFIKVFGEGSEKSRLVKLINKYKIGNKIKIFKPISPKKLDIELKKSDGFIITLDKGGALSKTLPAKLQTYLSFGKPIICSASGELYNFIRTNNLGFACRVNNQSQIINAFKDFKNLNISKRRKIFYRSKKIFDSLFELNNWYFNLNKKLYKTVKIYKKSLK